VGLRGCGEVIGSTAGLDRISSNTRMPFCQFIASSGRRCSTHRSTSSYMILTSTYFEGLCEQIPDSQTWVTIADGRSDCRQVVIALCGSQPGRPGRWPERGACGEHHRPRTTLRQFLAKSRRRFTARRGAPGSWIGAPHRGDAPRRCARRERSTWSERPEHCGQA